MATVANRHSHIWVLFTTLLKRENYCFEDFLRQKIVDGTSEGVKIKFEREYSAAWRLHWMIYSTVWKSVEVKRFCSLKYKNPNFCPNLEEWNSLQNFSCERPLLVRVCESWDNIMEVMYLWEFCIQISKSIDVRSHVDSSHLWLRFSEETWLIYFVYWRSLCMLTWSLHCIHLGRDCRPTRLLFFYFYLSYQVHYCKLH